MRDVRQYAVAFVAWIAVIAACGARTAPHPQTPDRSLFKGRLASVGFATKVEPKRTVVSLVFLVDDPYAMGPRDESLGQRMARVVTDWPAGDLSELDADNYMQTMNAMLRDGVRLGESYIVATHHPGALGPELMAVESATAASESRFLLENRTYLLNCRWFYDRIALQSRVAHLRLVKQEIARLVHESQQNPDDPEWAKGIEPLIKSKVEALNTERQQSIDTTTQRLGELRTERAHATDTLEQQFLDHRIADTEQSLIDLRNLTIESGR